MDLFSERFNPGNFDSLMVSHFLTIFDEIETKKRGPLRVALKDSFFNFIDIFSSLAIEEQVSYLNFLFRHLIDSNEGNNQPEIYLELLSKLQLQQKEYIIEKSIQRLSTDRNDN